MLGHIYQTEGLKALWKGLGPNLFGIIPSRATYFGTYSHGKNFLVDLNNGVESSRIHLVAAAFAGITVATFTCPIWVIKTRMQLQNSTNLYKYSNSFECLKFILREEGIRSLYRGLGASYLGVSEGTIQFVLYEKMKKTIQTHRQKQNDNFPRPFQGIIII